MWMQLSFDFWRIKSSCHPKPQIRYSLKKHLSWVGEGPRVTGGCHRLGGGHLTQHLSIRHVEANRTAGRSDRVTRLMGQFGPGSLPPRGHLT
ncbi:MAG: hypothetical protein ACJAQ3_001365 [Planctomycetota bacterium]|jgi:hypothetical protein